MKFFVSIVCLCFGLIMIGCASNGGGNVKEDYKSHFTKESSASELFWQGDAERSQPRFSAEGQEYIKVSLVEAVSQSMSPANRGKELFFETSEVMVKHAGKTGYYYVSSFSEMGEVGMIFYGEYFDWQWFSAVLYRVKCFESGVGLFSIDSFID